MAHVMQRQYLAVQRLQLGVVEVLIQYGADLELADDVGVSPLSVAAYLGSTRLVALLLEHGASYTRRDRVCMCVYVCVCVACVHVCMCLCGYVCACVCVGMCVGMCPPIHVRVCLDCTGGYDAHSLRCVRRKHGGCGDARAALVLAKPSRC